MSPQHQGRTHILPKEGDSLGYWLKVISGIVGLVVVIVGATMFFGGQAERVSVLETRADSTDSRVAENRATLTAIFQRLDEIADRLSRIEGVLSK